MTLALLLILKGKFGGAPLLVASAALSLLGGLVAGEFIGAVLAAFVR